MRLPKRDGVNGRYYLIHKPDTDAEVLEQELRTAGLPASIVGEILPKQEIEIAVTDK